MNSARWRFAASAFLFRDLTITSLIGHGPHGIFYII
jgi:hypothetical protein